MIRVEPLRKLDPVSWTSLFKQQHASRDTVVTGINREPVNDSRVLTRYIVSLKDHTDPITLIAKKTRAKEARFYYESSRRLSFLLPKTWFIHVSGNDSWILMDEVYKDRPANKWTGADVEEIIENLASFHATYWDRAHYLQQSGFLLHLGRTPNTSLWQQQPSIPSEKALDSTHNDKAKSTEEESIEQGIISRHALHYSGNLAPTLMKAAKGLEILRRARGWPGVINERHMEAMADLLDDPVPMLHPLRQLPLTMLHGNPSPEHWHLSLFDECRLTGWSSVSIGPGIYDLLSFLEQFDLLEDKSGGWCDRGPWPLTEETLVDSYILAMKAKLGPRYNASDHRLAIPASRCLHLVTTWLPRFTDWFHQGRYDLDTWQKLNYLTDEQLVQAGFVQVVSVREYLSRSFNRFLEAYRSL
jgi:hypothetical protein